MTSFHHKLLARGSRRPDGMGHTKTGWICAFRRALDALVFPWSCLVCGAEGINGPFCHECRETFLKQSATVTSSCCPRCALPVGLFVDIQGGCASCRDRHFGFDEALALGLYDGHLREFCLRLKHEENAWLAPWLSDLLVDARRDLINRVPADAWITPIPLHTWRRLSRGYNQADALAHRLARRLALPFRQPLQRLVATERLARKGRTERAQLMHGVFRTLPRYKLSGRTVVLVDDVLTTGATCSAAAKALKQAGAVRVIAVVIARADQKTV
jgi:ComF family protein